MTELKPVFQTPDGLTFETKKDAENHLRRPQIKAAILKLTDNESLADWLIDHREDVESAMDVGTIRRVSKSESAKLAKALEEIAAANNPKFAFVTTNAEAILSSFRWPSVKRMDNDEKSAAIMEALTVAADGNEKVAAWVVSNREKLFEAYNTGVTKRTVNPAAAEALANYRAQRAAEKAAREAEAEKAE